MWFYTYERKWFSAPYSPAESLFHCFLCISRLSQHRVPRVVDVAKTGRRFTFIIAVYWGPFLSLLYRRSQTHCKSQQLPHVLCVSKGFSYVLLSTLVNCHLFDEKVFSISTDEKLDLANVKETDKSKIQFCSFPPLVIINLPFLSAEVRVTYLLIFF